MSSWCRPHSPSTDPDCACAEDLYGAKSGGKRTLKSGHECECSAKLAGGCDEQQLQQQVNGEPGHGCSQSLCCVHTKCHRESQVSGPGLPPSSTTSSSSSAEMKTDQPQEFEEDFQWPKMKLPDFGAIFDKLLLTGSKGENASSTNNLAKVL